MIYNDVRSLSLGLSQCALENMVPCFCSLDLVNLHSHHPGTVKFPGCTVFVVAISSSARHGCCGVWGKHAENLARACWSRDLTETETRESVSYVRIIYACSLVAFSYALKTVCPLKGVLGSDIVDPEYAGLGRRSTGLANV
jgi:hypothetical protein